MNKTEIGILKAYHEALAFINACEEKYDGKLIAKARQIEYCDISRYVDLNLPSFLTLNEWGCNY